MTTLERIRKLSDNEMRDFIMNIYLAGKNGYGFAFCDYRLESWLKKENNDGILVNITKGLEDSETT